MNTEVLEKGRVVFLNTDYLKISNMKSPMQDEYGSTGEGRVVFVNTDYLKKTSNMKTPIQDEYGSTGEG